jgi:hypothetical protein
MSYQEASVARPAAFRIISSTPRLLELSLPLNRCSVEWREKLFRFYRPLTKFGPEGEDKKLLWLLGSDDCLTRTWNIFSKSQAGTARAKWLFIANKCASISSSFLSLAGQNLLRQFSLPSLPWVRGETLAVAASCICCNLTLRVFNYDFNLHVRARNF